MSQAISLSSNFTHLKEHDEQLLRVGMLAERYFTDDPNTCLLKLRQFAELLAQSTVDRLTPSTLAKAFRGELVPQDPADEPASALLARLRASRSATPKLKPRRRLTVTTSSP